MHLTRQELEDIWESKPHGFFTKMVKDLKGKKKYVVRTDAKKVVVVDSEVRTVWAKDANAAQYLAHNTNISALRRRLGVDMWDNSMSYSTKAMEAK